MLAIDLFCGLGGWSEGLLAEGYDVVGFDIEQHIYGEHRYPAQLVVQDVLTLHGSQFRNAALIVASPPCQEYSYMAMPWSRAKAIAADYRSGKRDTKQLTALFDACFRIQREASQAAGRHIPMVVENVRGAQPWVGRSRWSFGSFHLWGDVPALMPMTVKAQKFNPDGTNHGTGSWFAIADSKNRGSKNTGGSWVVPPAGRKCAAENNPDGRASGKGQNPDGRKHGGDWFSDPSSLGRQGGVTGRKQPGISGPRDNGKGDAWFQDGAARHGSKSSARKFASAMIAKIPLVLSRHIAATYRPATEQSRANREQST